MNARRSAALCVLLAFSCTACQRELPADPATGTAGTAPAATAADDAGTPAVAATPSIAGNAGARYRCDDGSEARISDDGSSVEITQGDGRRIRLPRAESASAGSGAAYVGEALSLAVDPDAVWLYQDEGPARACTAH